MSTPNDVNRDRKVTKHLLPAWRAAVEDARNGFDEAANNERTADLASQIKTELPYCSDAVRQECAKLGIYAATPIDVGMRDLSR